MRNLYKMSFDTESKPRYIIGIDLGTTHCSVAYVDTNQAYNPSLSVQQFRIPQRVAGDGIEAAAILPSFCYLLDEPEKTTGRSYTVGLFAQQEGAKVPTRLVASAKSWLCNPASSRREPILPIECIEESFRISPVEASFRYLLHIKEGWNNTFARGDPDSIFEEQAIILTVPASFDEVARTLTIEAAKKAGYTNMTLLEEPQAAFYHWLHSHEKEWEFTFKEGDRLLVCDVGGGTTDFSLIDVQRKGEELVLQRMAVGRHLLLGGDNMDIALAHYLEKKVRERGRELDSVQWSQLIQEARSVKEVLLSGEKARMTAVIQKTGSQIVRNSISIEITKEEVEMVLLGGFFELLPYQEAVQLKKAEGIRTLGLPYEADASIIKQLAHFLYKIGGTSPSHLLFNGGTLKPRQFQQAIIDALHLWFPEKRIVLLTSDSLDLAVSRGAAYFGKVRRGLGVRIQGGAACSFYLAVEIKGSKEIKALTLLPKGSEPGDAYRSAHSFLLVPNTPVSFSLYSSHVRLHDRKGDLVAIESEEMTPLPPLHTVLHYGKQGAQEKIPVQVEVVLSEVGILEIGLCSEKSDHRWHLEFQLSASGGEESSTHNLDKERKDETFEMTYLHPALETIRAVYQDPRTIKPKELMPRLETSFERPRENWPPSLLRKLWESLFAHASYRHVSSEHECRWWNMAGFVLRPGYGYPLDDYRMKQLWKIMLGDRQGSKSAECLVQQWICFRRVAGGLARGQQMQLAAELIPLLIDKKTGKIICKGRGDEYAYSEKIRTFASLERIELSLKIKIGNALIERLLNGEAQACDAWALGRIGARQLIHGSLANVVPAEICQKWLDQLIAGKKLEKSMGFTIAQIARKTNYREINLSDAVMHKAAEYLCTLEDTSCLESLLHHDHFLTAGEQEYWLGDPLPIGLILEG